MPSMLGRDSAVFACLVWHISHVNVATHVKILSVTFWTPDNDVDLFCAEIKLSIFAAAPNWLV